MKRLFALLLALFAITSAFADSVSPDRALSMAREFLNNGSTKFNAGAGRNLTLAYQARSHEGKPDYYVFNLDGNGGFLVVTGDDRTVPVWGYSTSGSFDFESMPENMKWWFSEYQRQLQYLRDNPNVNPRKATKLATSVSPLLTTKWNQCIPYNDFCPYAPMESDTYLCYGNHAPTGCVATCLAQIMKYHNWPRTGEGSVSYSPNITYYDHESSSVKSYTKALSADFSKSNYQWHLMNDEYLYKDKNNVGYFDENGHLYVKIIDENGDTIVDPNRIHLNAVAKLFSDIGIATQMDYGYDGSDSDIEKARTALLKNFRYEAELIDRKDYDDAAWDQLLMNELLASRPIYYRGTRKYVENGVQKNGGHAFVFDGFNSEGQFHINWGWGGSSDDGYFVSSLTEVPVQGDHYYRYDQMALIGIRPRTGKSFSANVAIPNLASLIVGSDRSTPLTVVGQNLDQDVSISVSGDASMFSTVSSISAADANSDEGKTVKVVYKPTKAGSHTAYLTLSAGEGVEPVTLTVTGSASVYSDADGNEKLNIDDLAYAIDQILNGGSLENTGTDATIDDVTAIIDALLGVNDMVGLDEGLVAYYPFDGNANDASGNGNHGQVTNLSLTKGVSGDTRGAYLFGGYYNQGHIRIPNSASLKFTDGFTFACYVKPTSWGGMDGWGDYIATGGTHCIFAKSTDRNGPHMSFSGDESGMNVGVGTMHSASQWTSIATDGQFQGNHKNEWIHVAVTYDKKQARLYINGNLVKQKNITADFGILNANDFYLGAFPRPESGIDWWYPMNGVMDEVRIYNRTLSPAEVNELAMDNLEDIEEKNPFRLSTSAVKLAVGETVTVNMLNGSGNYSLGSNIGIVDYALNGDSFTLTGKGVGTTNVTVIDVATQTTILLPVTVTANDDNHEWVDLGLPSGTLWATCNVGANAPEEYGDYFAWGETAPKSYYAWGTYKWSNGSYMTMTKYCTNSDWGYNGFVDNKTELDPEDDAAYVNWGPSWRIPSKEQQDELHDNCTWTWTQQNGVSGIMVTGPNGNTLFLPITGYGWFDSLEGQGKLCGYWSRTLFHEPNYAYIIYCFSPDVYNVSDVFLVGRDSRPYGFPVRAVRVSQN